MVVGAFVLMTFASEGRGQESENTMDESRSPPLYVVGKLIVSFVTAAGGGQKGAARAV